MPPYRERAKAGHSVQIVPRMEPARTQTLGQLNAVLKPFTFKVLNIQKSSSTPLIIRALPLNTRGSLTIRN